MTTPPFEGVDLNEANQLRVAQLAEYTQYRAVSPIYWGHALAYNPGDMVPASNVERHGYDQMGLVERVQTEVEAKVNAHEELNEPADASSPHIPAEPEPDQQAPAVTVAPTIEPAKATAAKPAVDAGEGK